MVRHFAIGLALAAAFGGQAVAQSASDVIATVNGVDITLGQMIIARNQLPPQYQQLPPDVLFNGVLEQLIQQQLLAASVGEEPSRVTIAVENERRALMAGEAINAINEDAVTPDAVQKAYEEFIAGTGEGEEFNAAHILVATEEEARTVLARLSEGEEFAAIAREVSTDFGSGANGGDLGWFGRGMMVAPFEEAVLALAEGEISEPVETQFGWHIVTLLGKRQVTPPTLEDLRADLEAQVRQKAIEAEIEALQGAAEITRADTSAIDPAVLQDLSLIRE